MKKTCFAVFIVISIITLLTIGASAETWIAVGPTYVPGPDGGTTLTLAGEVGLTDKLSLEGFYANRGGFSELELYLKSVSTSGLGNKFGPIGGIAFVSGSGLSVTGYVVGVWVEQDLINMLVLYGKAGYSWVPSLSMTGVTGVAGVRAKIWGPVFVQGEGIFGSRSMGSQSWSVSEYSLRLGFAF